MERAPEVLDCWLDSGSMPFAQDHWPWSTRPLREAVASARAPKLFPADFISEAIDQTRGWFYTLLAVSTTMGFGAPYKNVVSLGHVLDEKGEKMSKSKGNIINPWEMVEKYGADAVRWYFYTVNDPGDPKLYNEKDLDLAQKKFLLTFWNCYVFLKTYAPGVKVPRNSCADECAWTAGSCRGLKRLIIGEVNPRLEKYDITARGQKNREFYDQRSYLCGIVRRSRRRLQQPKNPAELNQAAKIFAYVLANLAKIAAPFVPFLSEEIWQGLNGNNFIKAKSVHLESWPAGFEKNIDDKLEKEMEEARNLVAWGLAERAKHGVKVRQPLAGLILRKENLRADLYNLIKDEINVKKVIFDGNLPDNAQLDWDITPELKEEGSVREIMRRIQELRKTAKFTPQDKITIYIQDEGELKNAIEKHQAMIVGETKALGIKFEKPAKISAQIETKIGNQALWVGIKKC